jgi:hypothetical protein
MSEENQKRKNDEGEVEWSFDFADLSNSVKGMFDSLAGEVEIQTSNFAVARSGVENARIKLSFAAGKNNLAALDATSPNLFVQKPFISSINRASRNSRHRFVKASARWQTPMTWNGMSKLQQACR